MLGKLIKYELLSGWKKFTVLYAIAIGASLMMRLIDTMHNELNDSLPIMELLFAMVLQGLVWAIVIMTVVFVVQGFYKSMLKDEGYLTHTLPVPEWKILAAKFLSGYIWYFAAIIVLILRFIIISHGELLDLYSLDDWDDPKTLLFLAQALFLPMLIMAKVFLSFGLGNLSDSHKLGISVLAFFGISIVENTLTTVIAYALMSGDVSYTRHSAVALVLDIVLAAADLVIAERIFTKRLNLE